MKLVTYEQNGRTHIGAVRDGGVINLTSIAPDMLHMIEMGAEGLTLANDYVQTASASESLAAVNLLAPIPVPRRNVMCLGLNYADHAAESKSAETRSTRLPEVPIIFNKATTAVIGPYDDIPFDAAVSERIDWEVELGVIIGKRGKNIAVAAAMSFVFGYTIINDVSARDLQRQHRQFFKGKSLDGSCPTGPWIVTADSLSDPHVLRLTCRINDITKQDGNTSQMIFNIPATIEYLSRGMTLLPGDIIATGTPAGVGDARTPPEYLKPGDIVESEIEGIGVLRNGVTAV